MRIGFANIYSFRPHVEHLYYLSLLVKQLGNDTFFLTCDSSVSSCYPRMLKGTRKLVECPKCILGGIRSYPVQSVSSISACNQSLDEDVLDRLALSSSCTLVRTESDNEWNDPDLLDIREKLYAPVSSVYESTLRWVEQNKLDAVICFNGRMDMMRALTYACEKLNVPYITHERTWFGHGLQLIPNANCLSLKQINLLAGRFQHEFLTGPQARLAGKLAGARFLQRNSLEWRVYNEKPEPAPWPLQSAGDRVLILPSSKNEFSGHAEWASGWKSNTEALDDFLEAFSIDPKQVVLRCHPNWAENIGKVSGERSASHYESWAKSRGVYFIPGEAKASTYDLIQQADIVVMNGGSSAVEAGVCGKQVVCLGPATYEMAGFTRTFRNRDELFDPGALKEIDPDTIIRKTLRFIYLSSNRFPQFVEYVRAVETTRYKYFEGADPGRLVSMLKTGMVEPDDAEIARDAGGEDPVVDALKERRWSWLVDYEKPVRDLRPLNVERRFGLRWVDRVRARLPRGDR